jgi:hypothetical protein
VTRHLAWITVLLVGGTAVAMLLVGLVFVPVAAIVATLGVLLAGIFVEAAGDRLVRPMRRLVRSIEDDAIGDQSLHDLPCRVARAASVSSDFRYALRWSRFAR